MWDYEGAEMGCRMITKRQAAERFQVSTRSIYRWRSVGLLRAMKVNRVVLVPTAELETLASRRTGR